MHPLFANQELVAAICSDLRAEHGFERWVYYHRYSGDFNRFRRTALVSSHFFYGMLPYIWEHVGVLDFFRRGLIPGEITHKKIYDPTQVHISGSISRKTMSRFHFYAPYIKTLKVPSLYRATEIYNWEPLMTYSKDNELLPNLVEFESTGFHSQSLSVFLSHSTRKITIETLDYQRQLDMTELRQILEYAMHKCPGLYSLKCYPQPSATTDAFDSTQVLSSFEHLVHLVSTPLLLQSTALQLVAQLPRLNTLSIKPIDDGHWDSSLCQPVPASGFPALRDLTLHLEKPRDAKRFWELIPFGVLKKLDLTILAAGEDQSEFTLALCQASPQITELALRFVEPEGWSSWFYKITANMLEHLARLPIESCSFERAKLDSEGAWVKVANSWPNLRSIRCLDQPTNLEDLMSLSSNHPRLENIECFFDLERAARTVGANWAPVGRPLSYPSLQTLASSRTNIMKITSGPELRGLARFLAYFWPKLNVKSLEQYVSEDPDSDDPDLLAELLTCKEAVFRVFQELILAHVELYHKVTASGS